jgi:rubrerythrin
VKESTKANLQEAFAGESQAQMKYSIFADRAEREGFPEVARLFRAIAFAEQVHAANHLRELGGIGKTEANLEQAIGGENYEVDEMYPAFDAVARIQEKKAQHVPSTTRLRLRRYMKCCLAMPRLPSRQPGTYRQRQYTCVRCVGIRRLEKHRTSALYVDFRTINIKRSRQPPTTA